jgi:hypothetical protein
VPEANEEYGAFGINPAGGYFASRSAPIGAVPNEVIIATFYNFSPGAIRKAMPGVWEKASPQQLQAARFRVVERACRRVGVALTDEQIAEARALVDPVVAGLTLGGRPLAAGNAAVPLPDDPLTALWQQITVVREWRGDAHIAVLVANDISPAECLALQVGLGRFPAKLAQATRQWPEDQWTAALDSMRARGWAAEDGTITDAGKDAREANEAATDALCAPIWRPIGEAGAARLKELIAPIHAAIDAAGTYSGTFS